jgi:hypothetical protein
MLSVTATGAFAIIIIIIIMTTLKCYQMRKMTMDPLRSTCWKFGLLGVTPVILIVPTLICLLLTSSYRHWWEVSPEWHTAHLGQNPTSLDDSATFSCQHRNPILPRDLQTVGLDLAILFPFVTPRPAALEGPYLTLSISLMSILSSSSNHANGPIVDKPRSDKGKKKNLFMKPKGPSHLRTLPRY